MNLKKRLTAVLCILAMLGAVIFGAMQTDRIEDVIPENVLPARPTIRLWYTDEAIGEYLSSVAFAYQEANDVRVLPVLTSGLEYLEAVNDASVEGQDFPDLFVVSNDSLEKAYLAGLAQEVDPEGSLLNPGNFPQAALDAVTYQGKKTAFPLYYETSALVYNQTYLAQAAAEMETDAKSLVPRTIEDILSFADSYNAPETVEAVFKWDVSDIFYNYFFAGNYISVGGPCGDEETQIDIYNEEAVIGLKAYQDLNQFFSIDAETSSYEAVVQDFLDGKLIFTVATTDILGRIAETSAAGAFPYEYGTVPLPDVNGQVKAKGLSVTYALAVNGYGAQKELAVDFARFLVEQESQKMYERTGKLPARKQAVSDVPGADGFVEEYADSMPMPKLMSTANFWVWMEVAYTKIWQGENVSDILKALSEQIMTQVTGSEYVEETYIEVPTVEETTVEEIQTEAMD